MPVVNRGTGQAGGVYVRTTENATGGAQQLGPPTVGGIAPGGSTGSGGKSSQGGGGGASGGGGGGVSGGSSGGGGSGGGLAFPKFTPPSWWPSGGIHSLTDLANTVRDAFFAGLGSTQGFPYDSSFFYQVLLDLQWSGEAIPSDLTLALEVFDPSGVSVAQGSWPVDAIPSPLVLTGTFSTDLNYSIVASLYQANGDAYYAFPTTTAAGSSLYGTTGQPIALDVPLSAAGSTGWMVTVKVVDAAGDLLSGQAVSLAIVGPDGNSFFSGTGTSNSNGLAVFSNAQTQLAPGGYSLTAKAAGGVTTATYTNSQMSAGDVEVAVVQGASSNLG